MTPAMIQLILTELVIPGLGLWLKHRNQPTPPTPEEVRAQLTALADLYLTEGEAFLRLKGVIV